MAYSLGHPLMVIVETGLKSEGLLERGNDWYVQWVKPEVAALSTVEFNGVLASFKQKMINRPENKEKSKDTSELTVGELVGGLKPTQLWSVLGALAALVGGAFALGAKLFGG
jgi:hypothetical protein